MILFFISKSLFQNFYKFFFEIKKLEKKSNIFYKLKKKDNIIFFRFYNFNLIWIFFRNFCIIFWKIWKYIKFENGNGNTIWVFLSLMGNILS